MVTTEALKLLYTKLGGTEDVESVTAISEMVDLIEDVAGQGGGSSLPEVTSDDNGDVLTVVEGEWAKAEPATELPTASASNVGQTLTVNKSYTKGAVIVPEQTVTLVAVEDGDPEAECSNANLSLFTVGTKVIVDFDGNEYLSEIMEEEGEPFLAFGNNDFGGFYIDNNVLRIFADVDPDTYNISLYVAQETYGWSPASQYDIVVDTVNGSSTVSNYSVTWDYDAVKAKVRAGEFVKGVLNQHLNYDEEVDGDTTVMPFSLGAIRIFSAQANMMFWGYNGETKMKWTFTFEPDTGEILTVFQDVWS